jgi:hypothetical protein
MKFLRATAFPPKLPPILGLLLPQNFPPNILRARAKFDLAQLADRCEHFYSGCTSLQKPATTPRSESVPP